MGIENFRLRLPGAIIHRPPLLVAGQRMPRVLLTLAVRADLRPPRCIYTHACAHVRARARARVMCTYNGKRERNWDGGWVRKYEPIAEFAPLLRSSTSADTVGKRVYRSVSLPPSVSFVYRSSPRRSRALNRWLPRRDATRRDARCGPTPQPLSRFLPAPRSGMYRVIAFEGWLKFPRDTIRLLFASSHSRESILHPLHLDLEKYPPRQGKAGTAGGFN